MCLCFWQRSTSLEVAVTTHECVSDVQSSGLSPSVACTRRKRRSQSIPAELAAPSASPYSERPTGCTHGQEAGTANKVTRNHNMLTREEEVKLGWQIEQRWSLQGCDLSTREFWPCKRIVTTDQFSPVIHSSTVKYYSVLGLQLAIIFIVDYLHYFLDYSVNRLVDKMSGKKAPKKIRP